MRAGFVTRSFIRFNGDSDGGRSFIVEPEKGNQGVVCLRFCFCRLLSRVFRGVSGWARVCHGCDVPSDPERRGRSVEGGTERILFGDGVDGRLSRFFTAFVLISLGSGQLDDVPGEAGCFVFE